jgi:hypothetical protein
METMKHKRQRKAKMILLPQRWVLPIQGMRPQRDGRKEYGTRKGSKRNKQLLVVTVSRLLGRCGKRKRFELEGKEYLST